MEIKHLTVNHLDLFKQLILLFENVFEMNDFHMPPDDHLIKVLADDHFFCFTAIEDGVVGGLTGYVLEQYYSKQPLAYIYDLAVVGRRQGQGIGKKLIQHTTQHFKLQNFEEVFVQADRVDQSALAFYRATKPSDEEDVIHFYYTL